MASFGRIHYSVFSLCWALINPLWYGKQVHMVKHCSSWIQPARFVLIVFFAAFGGLCSACGRASQEVVPTAAVLVPGERGALKLYVAQEGIYRLRQAELDYLGFNLDPVDPMRFELSLRGAAQPLWVLQDDGEFTLFFYGIGSDSLYSREAVYWLDLLPEPAALTQAWNAEEIAAPGAAGAQSTYQAAIHQEENLLYYPQSTQDEHWYWAAVYPGVQQEFSIELADVADGPGYLQVDVWANTEDGVSPDHHTLVSVNEQVVIDETWDGIGQHTLEVELPAGLLVEGNNKVRVELPGDTGASAEAVLVNWIAFDYARVALAEDDALVFDSAGYVLSIDGMKGALAVFDITQANQAQMLGSMRSDGQVNFQGQAEQRYLIVGRDGYLQPTRMSAAELSPDLRTESQGAEYVAVGSANLLEALKPMLEWRTSQGVSSLAVPLEAIYDQFGDGFPEPEAVRVFLQYAASHWETSPKYVLLVGDATFDPLGYQSEPGTNLLPTYFVQTFYGGQTASDLMFALLDDDELPDLAIGRVPVQTQEQLGIFVEKTLAYEQNASEAGLGDVLAVADGQEASFRGDAQAFLDLFVGQETVLYAPDAGSQGASDAITTYLEQGFGLVAYFGHGSVNMWGKDRLFTVEDVSGLSNEHLPIMIHMTCLNGLFTHPKMVSLAEALLLQPGGGAIAVLAPTSLTLPLDQSFLSQPLGSSILDPSITRLGDALLHAQRQIPVDGVGTQDVIRTFLLFGDPALLLAGKP